MSTAARVAVKFSSEISSSHLGISFSSIFFSLAVCSSVASGKRILLTLISTTVTMPASRSVSTRESIHIAPNTGSFLSFNVTPTAARAVSLFPSKVSGCGWYIIISALDVFICRGQPSSAPSRVVLPLRIMVKNDRIKDQVSLVLIIYCSIILVSS